ncbi:Laminin G domain protein [Planctomycetes bacterium CA13]|uniref:Laminin G domain protein n=1 Tax=Novipirellula herctigrandis TaxID=2527986 RepID=A0A5C5ZAF3_9BACT|nr:Laminin G domain protein [Planctomycetes bacterium CA13]
MRTFLIFLLTTTLSVQAEEPWRFINLADWHSAEKFVMRDASWYDEAVQKEIQTIKRIKNEYGGELMTLPGDSNSGHWDTPDFIQKFSPGSKPEDVILRAGKLCYEGMIDTFAQGGYSTLLMAVGDHELGDNPWPAGSDVARCQPQFRESFARAFNYSQDGKVFRYSGRIGAADARPLGTIYEDTSFACVHKNVLFVTIDAFHQEHYTKTIGEEGSVTGAVEGKHLEWLESVLSEARKDAAIKHIIVQSHLPVLYPVRKVNSSGMVFDDDAECDFWKVLRKHDVDMYLAGEVHANTVTKDPESSLLQVVTRGNSFSNFQTVDISDDKIEMTLYAHSGESLPKGSYRETGKLIIDKSESETTFHAEGGLALFDTTSRLLHFNFEENFDLKQRTILGLGEAEKHRALDGAYCTRSFANCGTFGPQYDALHYNVELVPGKNGMAGKFTDDSRMGVFGMGPMQGGLAVAYELSFNTQSEENQILINTASIWSKASKNFLNLYLDNGIPVVAISDKQFLIAQPEKLNDGQWHSVQVRMPHHGCMLSEVIIEVDGQRVEVALQGQDEPVNVLKSFRLNVGGRSYGHRIMTKLPVSNFIGLIDDVSVWSLQENE